jgi:hypothetical protein
MDYLVEAIDAQIQRERGYQERNRVAILAASLAQHLGMRTGVYVDPDEKDPRFRRVLQIDLPTGQVTFHLDEQDTEWVVFGPHWHMVRDYDGHDNETKWARVADFIARHAVHSSDELALASFRETAANLQAQIQILRAQKQSLAERYGSVRQECQRQRQVLAELRTISAEANAVDLFDNALGIAEKLADEKMREMETAETSR